MSLGGIFLWWARRELDGPQSEPLHAHGAVGAEAAIARAFLPWEALRADFSPATWPSAPHVRRWGLGVDRRCGCGSLRFFQVNG